MSKTYGIYIASLDQHQMYFWVRAVSTRSSFSRPTFTTTQDEKEGKKTPNNILSAVHACLQDRATGCEALHWWSDNTTAQLKCWATIRYCVDICHPAGFYFFKRVDHL